MLKFQSTVSSAEDQEERPAPTTVSAVPVTHKTSDVSIFLAVSLIAPFFTWKHYDPSTEPQAQ